MRTIKNISILPVLVLFILIEILVTYNVQALTKQDNIINNRWYNSFYIDTTFNKAQSNSVVCYGDSLFIVSWIQEMENNYTRIYIKRIVSDSISIDSQPIDITENENNMYNSPDIAILDSCLFIVYSSPVSGGADINASIFNTNNDSISKISIDTSYYFMNPIGNTVEFRSLRAPIVTSGKNKYLVIYGYHYYHEYPYPQGAYEERYLLCRLLNKDGQTSHIFALPFSDFSEKSLIFDGENYIFLSNRNSELHIIKIDTSGSITKQDSISLYSSDVKFEVGTNAVASGNSRYLVVWSDYTGGSHCIIGRLYSEDLSIIDSSIFISEDQYVKIYPSVVFDGNNFIVTWQEYKWDSYNIKGAVVSPFGCIIDSFLIDNNSGDQVDTKLAYGNGYILLTYTSWSPYFGTNKIMGKFNDQTAAGIVKRNEKEQSRIMCFAKYSDTNKVILRYSIEQSSYIKLKLFDLTGRNIKKLGIGNKDKGTYSIILDCSSLTRGVYFYNLEYGNNIYSGKINIMR